MERDARRLAVRIATPRSEADLQAVVQLDAGEQSLPEHSVFPDVRAARRFAGPMPFTFSYEPQTRSIVRIEGQRQEWHPRLVPVEVRQAAFFRTRGLTAETPRPASAFLVEHVPYRWNRGIVEPLRLGGTR